ncbi:DsbA family protein [Streptomyces sp. TRM72054]|uniref:thioredoxin domain-containing protein n=1 Tax=Streptomyces sp. TRM72054 TaxID=2870562 RepID=UPI001C8C31A0|nr:thioredoxin domain-containing protein [Streptomyces sp. TRM72054]MBX9399376.1 DsbA family protein [Streptomyces sp. TRM72054]
MSARNSQATRSAARDRLRAEPERQAKKEKLKRQLIVAASIVGVLAAAGGAGYLINDANKPDAWEAAKNAKLVQPSNTTGKDGTTVILGKADAKKTLKIYEDARCPICAQFEQTVGPTIENDLKNGKYKVEFIGATFVDRTIPGEGSRNALSALGAALNVSPDAFLAYKHELYSAKYHPAETDDKFKSDKYLIEVADQVPALKNNASFRKAVQDGTYDRWALEMSKKYDNNKDGVEGTPSFVMDGKKLTGANGKSVLMTVTDYNAAIDKALAGK